MSNRRVHERRTFTYPVNVSTGSRKDRAGMARDLSASGISFQSRSSFVVGERVVIQLRSPHGLNSAVGRVVRSMRGGEGVLPHFTAVAFDVPHLDLAA